MKYSASIYASITGLDDCFLSQMGSKGSRKVEQLHVTSIISFSTRAFCMTFMVAEVPKLYFFRITLLVKPEETPSFIASRYAI